MGLTYGGVHLNVPTAEQALRIAKYLPAEDVFGHDPLTWPGPCLAHLPFTPWLPPAVELGKLFWPLGAARFACGYYLVDDAQLVRIRALAYASNRLTPLPLVITDPQTGRTVSFDLMYMLPPRPIEQSLLSSSRRWLLTLVDVRYYWNKKPGFLTIPPAFTWVQLFEEIQAFLEQPEPGQPTFPLDIEYDTVHADYLTPDSVSRRFTVNYQHAALLFDAALFTAGLRLVAKRDGTFLGQNYTNARQSHDEMKLRFLNHPTTNTSVVAAALAAVSTGVRRFLQVMGGRYAFNAAEPTPANDLNALVPSAVTVIFAKAIETVLTINLASYEVSLESLRLPEFAGDSLTAPIVGGPGKKILYADYVSRFAATSSGQATNISNLRRVARQMARDYYRFALGRYDVAVAGCVPWEPDALTGQIVWTYRSDTIQTRVLRADSGPAWAGYHYNLCATPLGGVNAGSGSGSGSEGGSGSETGGSEPCADVVTGVQCVNGNIQVTYGCLRTMVGGLNLGGTNTLVGGGGMIDGGGNTTLVGGE